jgi:hypothetical protein
MVVLVVTGFRAALEMSRVARVRVICERSGSTPKGHTQRQHKRRDQQRYTPLHLLTSFPFVQKQTTDHPLLGGGVAGCATGSARPLQAPIFTEASVLAATYWVSCRLSLYYGTMPKHGRRGK